MSTVRMTLAENACGPRRRQMIAGGGLWAAGAVVGAGAAGVWPRAVHASTVAEASDEAARDARALQDVLRSLDGDRHAVDVDAAPVAAADTVRLSVPDLVENGAFVPVTVTSLRPSTEEIALIVLGNPDPLVVRFFIPAGTDAQVSTRIKVASSGRVYAVVKAEGRLWSAFTDTRVSIGGCG